jgi:uncharacterized protein (DUF2062 family)
MLRRRLQRWIPKPETVRANPSLRWLGPLLERPWLWQLSRRRVAAGAAIGIFFGFLIPVAQILLAAGAAILMRANLPVAAVSTLITNPFTFAPVYVAAYYTGSAVLGETPDEKAVAVLAEGAGSLLDKAADIGKPWAVGLVTFAVCGAAITWVVVNVGWIAAVRWRRWRGTRRAARGPPAA